MRYPLASSTWNHREIEAIGSVLGSGRYTMGSRVKEFEEQFADHFGARHAVMVNSGSSANLLAVAAMRYRNDALQPGQEVIVPSVSWGTTYYPLHQYGLRLNFVDVDLDTLNMDLDAVEEAITSGTRAIFAVNLLGAPNDFNRLREICAKWDLILLEDNCESMGATYDGKYAGTFGICGTFSTFFSHHICTMEGGVILTDDEEVFQIITSLRAHGWTRELPADSFVHKKSDDPFYETFRFVLPGYNVRPLEISAAAGLAQGAARRLPRSPPAECRAFRRAFRQPGLCPHSKADWRQLMVRLLVDPGGSACGAEGRSREATDGCRRRVQAHSRRRLHQEPGHSIFRLPDPRRPEEHSESGSRRILRRQPPL